MRSRMVAAALAVTLLPLPATAAAPAGAPCDVADFSPGFVRDGTAVCAHQAWRIVDHGPVLGSSFDLRDIEVYATTDRGRTWHRQPATGLPSTKGEHEYGPVLGQILFSPAYAYDGLVYLYVAGWGLWTSPDLGATWTPTDLLLLGPGPTNPESLTPIRLTPGSADGSTAALGGFAYAYGAGIVSNGHGAPINSLLFPPARTQAEGVPGLTRHFLVPDGWPDEPALAVGFTGTVDSGLWRCDETLACETPLWSAGKERVGRVWLGPEYPAKRVVYATVHAGKPPYTRVVRSTDGGAHFATWTAVQRLVPTGVDAVVDLAWEQAHAHHVFLHVTGEQGKYGAHFYESTDGGEHWSPRGRAPAYGAAGPRTLPFNAPWGNGYGRAKVWRLGSRLFTLARSETRRTKSTEWSDALYGGVFCSLDNGRHWSRGCAG